MWGWWKIGRFGYMADYINNNNSTQLVIDRDCTVPFFSSIMGTMEHILRPTSNYIYTLLNGSTAKLFSPATSSTHSPNFRLNSLGSLADPPMPNNNTTRLLLLSC